MDQRASFDMEAVLGVLTVLVLIIVGAYAFTLASDETGILIENTGKVHRENNITEGSFTTYANVDNWENFTSGTLSGLWDTIDGTVYSWGGEGSGTINWRGSLVVSDFPHINDIHLVRAAYMLEDDTELENIDLRVVLECPCGDNIEILRLDNTLHTADTWYYIDNDITDLIHEDHMVGYGQYYLHLWENIERVEGPPDVDRAGVTWDNTYIAFAKVELSTGEKSKEVIDDLAATFFQLAPWLALIGLVFLLVLIKY